MLKKIYSKCTNILLFRLNYQGLQLAQNIYNSLISTPNIRIQVQQQFLQQQIANLNIPRVQSSVYNGYQSFVTQPPMPIMIPQPSLPAMPLMSINLEQKENPKKRRRSDFDGSY